MRRQTPSPTIFWSSTQAGRLARARGHSALIYWAVSGVTLAHAALAWMLLGKTPTPVPLVPPTLSVQMVSEPAAAEAGGKPNRPTATPPKTPPTQAPSRTRLAQPMPSTATTPSAPPAAPPPRGADGPVALPSTHSPSPPSPTPLIPTAVVTPSATDKPTAVAASPATVAPDALRSPSGAAAQAQHAGLSSTGTTPSSKGAQNAATTQSPASLPRYDAAYLNNRPPRYPAKSVDAKERGRVTLDVYVDANGNPEKVSLKKSSGFERLDTAALDAVRSWRFEPARVGGQAVGADVVITIPFELTIDR